MTIDIMKPGHEYAVNKKDELADYTAIIKFQEGPVKEVGINGLQSEDLLEILMDRLTYLNTFENGKYACKDNEYAIIHLRGCLQNLQARTRARQKRNVEGTNQA